MSEQYRILVVVDPSDEKHVALERAIFTSKLYASDPKLYVFVGVDGEAVDTRATNDTLSCDQSWFEEKIQNPITVEGLEFEVEYSWSTEWQLSITQSAKLFGADLILLPLHRQVNRRHFTFSESKWALLKGAGCPIVLVRPGGEGRRKVVLAAVNFQATTDDQKALNKKILERGKWTADGYGAEFHVVNAYRDSMLYPDRGKLSNETGLPADKIHVKQGHTDEVVSSVAKEIGAELVIMGTLGQTGKVKTRRGNTAERVIGSLDMDVLVVNRSWIPGN